jgi:hypothetical protein
VGGFGQAQQLDDGVGRGVWLRQELARAPIEVPGSSEGRLEMGSCTDDFLMGSSRALSSFLSSSFIGDVQAGTAGKDQACS